MNRFLKTVFIFSFIDLTYTFILSVILNLIDESIILSQTEDMSLHAIFLVSVIIAPFFETFISQILFYNYLKRIINEKICFHFSAITFGLAHFTSFYLMFGLIPVGYLYIILFKRLLKFNAWYAYLGVVLVHMNSNLIGFLIDIM
jgi:membrane protease YdiL (CAAX protease family)